MSNQAVAIEDFQFTTREPIVEGWTFLNTASAIQVVSSSVVIEGVLRDENGEWILGVTPLFPVQTYEPGIRVLHTKSKK